MDTQEYELIPPPPGIIPAFKDGYQAIASHLTAILFPIALDLFLWLGPHLNISGFVQASTNSFRRLGPGPITANQAASYQKLFDWFEHFNFFSLLSTFPVGNSILLSGNQYDVTPVGSPAVISVNSLLEVFGWALLLTLFGWFAGGIYYNVVARAALPVQEGQPNKRIGFGHAILQVFVLSLTWVVICIMIGLPTLIVFLMVGFINIAIAQFLFLVVASFGVWLILPVYFSPHGIFVRRQKAVDSILSGIQMVRYTLPTSSLFLMGTVLISIGTNWLWRVPGANSWMLLIGIAGHGFVTSMLLASSFIYYRNMTEWLQAAFAQLRAKTPRPSQ